MSVYARPDVVKECLSPPTSSSCRCKALVHRGGTHIVWLASVQPDRRLYVVLTRDLKGRTYSGVKEQILSLCLKGRFYASHVFILNGKILRRALRSVPNRKILRNEHWRNFP